MISVEHSTTGQFPETRRLPAAAAIGAGVGVAISGSELVIATGAGLPMIGVTAEAATAAHQKIMYQPVSPGMLLRVTKTGTATPVVGTKYDLAADGMSVNADDTVDPKVKIIEALDPLPGQSAVSEWLAVNLGFNA